MKTNIPNSVAAKHVPPNRVSQSVLVGAAISGAALLLFTTFLLDVSDIISVFLMPFAAIGFGVIFLSTLAWAIYDFCRMGRYRHFQPFIPVLVHLVAAGIAWIVPLGEMRSDADFYRNLPQRQDIVNQIAEGELRPNVSYNPWLIRLPKEFRNLSRGGGMVAMSRKRGVTAVFFYVYHGTASNTTGFLYRSDDTAPHSGDCTIECS